MTGKKSFFNSAELEILEAASTSYPSSTEFSGFQIAKEIGERKGTRWLMGYGTLYQALNRLEKLGYLGSRWEDQAKSDPELRPRRKLYRLTRDNWIEVNL